MNSDQLNKPLTKTTGQLRDCSVVLEARVEDDAISASSMSSCCSLTATKPPGDQLTSLVAEKRKRGRPATTSLGVSIRERREAEEILKKADAEAERIKDALDQSVKARHCATTERKYRAQELCENPVDLSTRGITLERLIDCQLWWRGPSWLCGTCIPNDCAEYDSRAGVEERGPIVGCHARVDNDRFERFSSLSGLIRVTAYCKRFIFNAKSTNRRSGFITAKEMQEATCTLIKIVQTEQFNAEIRAPSSGRRLHSESKLICLSPFLDESALIRVGGRLKNAPYAFDRKHPILLPGKHAFTSLLIAQEHGKYKEGYIETDIKKKDPTRLTFTFQRTRST